MAYIHDLFGIKRNHVGEAVFEENINPDGELIYAQPDILCIHPSQNPSLQPMHFHGASIMALDTTTTSQD